MELHRLYYSCLFASIRGSSLNLGVFAALREILSSLATRDEPPPSRYIPMI
jgi:hypothetical protein